MLNPEQYARHIGANIGMGNYMPDKSLWKACEPYLVTIGNNCQITMGVRFFTHGGGQVIRNVIPNFDAFGKINIGNYVYIGNNSLIMPGVTIGDNVLIAAGSVVTKSIPPGYVAGGNPARIICTLEEYMARNKRFNTNSKSLSKKEKKELLRSLPEDRFIKKGYMKP